MMTTQKCLLCSAAAVVLILTSRAHADYASAVLADGPIAYWRFEDGNVGDIFGFGGETATDSSGNHHGTYFAAGLADGPQMVAAAPGLGTTAVHFMRGDTSQDGEFIFFDELGNFGSNIDNNGATFEFFVKNLQDPASNRLFGVWNERPTPIARTTQISFSLHRPTDRQELFLRDDTGNAQEFEFDDSVGDINDGQWHHVAWVIRPGVPASATSVYVDGISVPLTEVTNNPLDTGMFANFDKPLIIGGENAAGGGVGGLNPQSYTINAMVDEFAIYSNALSENQIQNHVAQIASTTFELSKDGLANWLSGSSWAPVDGAIGGIPNSNKRTAILGSIHTAPSTTVVDEDVTVKEVRFDSSISYAIAGSGSMNLEADAGNASVQVLQGSHQFQAVVNLNSNTIVDVASGSVLEFNNRLNLNGNNLSQTGMGTLAINSVVNADGGSVNAAAGVLTGNGTIEGDLVNSGGSVSPGNSPGILQVRGDYSQGPDANLLIEIAGTLAEVEHDVLRVSGTASLDGTLIVDVLLGFDPQAGDRFSVLDVGQVEGTFDDIQLPALSAGLRWHASELYASGALGVVSVPEPATLGLLLMGGLATGYGYGRRRHLPRLTWIRCSLAVSVISTLAMLNAANRAWAAYADAVLADNPIGYWRFEDGNQGDILNGATAPDEVGAHPGTYMAQGTGDGPQLVAGAPGAGFTAAHFVRDDSANGDYISLGQLGNLGSNIDENGLTIEFFLKNQQEDLAANRVFGIWNSRPDGTRTTMLTFGFQDLQERFGGPGDTVFIRDDSAEAWAYMVDDTGGTDIKDGNWHHIAWVVDPGVPTNGTRVYVDGDLATLNPAGSDGITDFGPKPLSNFPDFDKEFLLSGEHLFDGTKRAFLIDAIIDEFAVYSAALTQQQIQTHLDELPTGDPTMFQWGTNGLGSWNAVSNWQPLDGLGSAVPNANNATAIFGGVITSSATVVNEQNVTVKTIQFDNSHTYVIAGNGLVTLAGNASIDVLQGSHQFQVNAGLADDTMVDVAGSAGLEFNNRLSLNSNTLTKTGDGSLLVNNNANTGTGEVVVSGGVFGGAGRIGGSLTNDSGGTVAPGVSPGTLTVAVNYTQNPNSSLAIELGGPTPADEEDELLHDVLNVIGDVFLTGGTLDVTLIPGFTPSVNDSFDILEFASLNGSFDILNLPTGESNWNTTQLLTDGIITFVGGGGLPGDYDVDGDVDGTDFLIWQRGGSPNPLSAEDLALWEAQFGTIDGVINTVGNLGAPIPEPPTILGLLLALWHPMVVRKKKEG